MKRNASAQWKGSLKKGEGTITTESGVLDNAQYSFATRFEGGKGTNPEELIGAAHAGCYSMALSMILGEQDVTPESVDTSATVELKEVDGGFEISSIHLDVNVKADCDQATFDKATQAAKEGCPVSKLFNAEITMDARLSS